eukprot:6198065-Pleurochrysis_carterae.AAC.1
MMHKSYGCVSPPYTTHADATTTSSIEQQPTPPVTTLQCEAKRSIPASSVERRQASKLTIKAYFTDMAVELLKRNNGKVSTRDLPLLKRKYQHLLEVPQICASFVHNRISEPDKVWKQPGRQSYLPSRSYEERSTSLAIWLEQAGLGRPTDIVAFGLKSSEQPAENNYMRRGMCAMFKIFAYVMVLKPISAPHSLYPSESIWRIQRGSDGLARSRLSTLQRRDFSQVDNNDLRTSQSVQRRAIFFDEISWLVGCWLAGSVVRLWPFPPIHMNEFCFTILVHSGRASTGDDDSFARFRLIYTCLLSV